MMHAVTEIRTDRRWNLSWEETT